MFIHFYNYSLIYYIKKGKRLILLVFFIYQKIIYLTYYFLNNSKVINSFTSDIDFNKKQAKIINSKIKKLENEEEGLRGMRRRGEISGEEFIKDKNKLLNNIEDLQNNLIKLTRKNSQFLDDLNQMSELFVELKSKRKNADNTKKINIINSIVSELKIDNEKRLHIEEKPLFKAFRNSNINKWWFDWGKVRTNLVKYIVGNQDEVLGIYYKLKNK